MKVRILRWKRAAFAVLFTLLLSVAGVTNALAQTFTVGDLNYTINDDGNTVTVTGHVDGSSATGQLVIPESVELYGNSYPVTHIGGYAFDYCTGLTGSLVIPNSVIQIHQRAFRGCYGITQVILGDGLTNLGYDSFQQVGIIGEVTIPSSVSYIGDGVFRECSGLTTLNYNAVWAEGCLGGGWSNWLYGTSLSIVNIGEGVQYIPCDFLNNVSNLPVNQVILPESVTHIGSSAFYNFIGSVNIPNQVQWIGNSAFSNCTGLTGNLNLPETLIEIQSYAFFNCTGLTGSLTIPNSVQTIGEYAFNGCTNLSGTLTLGASLQSISQYAFFGFMNNVTEIQIYAMTPPYLGSSVFLGSNAQMPVYVPCGTLEAYQNASGWISFANIQEANPCHWEITATANPSVGGTVSGAGTFEQGLTCTLTATPAEGYEFLNWKEGDAVVSTEATYSFTVESHRNLVANFGLEGLCGIVFNLYDSYGDGWNGNKLVVSSTDGTYQELTINGGNYATYTLDILDGSHVTLSWIEGSWIEECSFNVHFTSNGYLLYQEQGSNLNGNPYEFDLNCDDAYTPIAISAVASPVEGGTVSGAGNYLCGEICTLIATASEGRNFVRWTENGEVVSTDATYSFTVMGPRNLVAVFSALISEIIVFADPNVEAICVNNWDTDGDGFLSYNEAASVTDFGQAFQNHSEITSFAELQYFTGLTSIAAYAFDGCSGLTGTLTLPASLTSIGDNAFNNCTGLTGTLTIPEAVTSIGNRAFANTGFTTVNFNATNCTYMGSYYDPVFADCSNLTTLNIGETVEIIPPYAFYNCSGFTGTIDLPETLTTIGEGAFQNCTGFTGSLVIPDNVTVISLFAFRECSGLNGTLTIGNSVTEIGGNAFYHCYGLTGELTIPDAVQNIGIGVFIDCGFTGTLTIGEGVVSINNAAFRRLNINEVHWNAVNCTYAGDNYWDAAIFAECNNMATLVFSEGVETIPEGAFYHCYALSGTLNLPNVLTSIGGVAFCGCSGLTGNLVIPDAVTYIGWESFEGCTGLVGTLTIGNSVSEISDMAFYNTGLTSLNYNAANCTYIGSYDYGNASVFYNFTTVNFGNNVESLPGGAFRNCTNLVGNLTLPNSLTTIGDQAFYNCYGFDGTIMSNSVETIGSEAFRNCGGFRGELTLPETLLSVGPSAFAGCNEISTVNYNATNCTVMGNASDNVFADCLSLAHLRIGANVQSIPNYAFKPCFLVTDMSVAAEVPPTIYSSTFGTISRNIPVSVPLGSSPAYRTAPYWEEFFHITEDYSPNSYTYHWNVNVHQFASNMTVTGIIQIEGVEQTVPSLEIGAFCNGECRGRQLLTYYPQVDRYLVFLMLYGEDGDVFTFRLYDHEAGEEITAGCASVITFETDAIVGSFLDPYVFNFTDMQLTQFSEGWNWWSTYVEQGGIDGLSLLQESLGDNGVAIRSQASGYTDYYAGYGWYGSLESINNESSYRVVTSAPCVAAMPGNVAIPSQHPITLSQGWTWIGYLPSRAMDINTALEGLEATQGDMVKSQQGYSDYYPGYGWFGSLNTVEPGMGLMYYSSSGETVTFTYPDSNRGGELKQNLTAENNHWKPNTFAYPDNMTVMATIELDGEELNSEHYELAAFANGECRGSVKLTHAEPLRRHVAFLTISGKDAAELSFRLYDTETGVEYYEAEESLDFVANAIVGTADDLYTIHFRGMTGMDELASKVQVYPNPVNAGERFSISTADDVKTPVSIEIVNALGVETLRATSVQTPAQLTAPATAGVYTLRITVEGKGTAVRKLVVK